MKKTTFRKGKNPGKAEIEARNQVFEMLPADGARIGWSQLEKKARSQGMSLRTLRKNLDKCEQAGVVARIVDVEARPPRVYYRLLTPEIFSEVYDRLPPEMRDVGPWMKRITKIKDPKLREQTVEAFLELQAAFLLMELVCVWHKGIASPGIEQAQGFYKIMVESYVAPVINNMGFLCRAHEDVALGPLDRLFSCYLAKAEEAMAKLTSVLGDAAEK